MNDETKQFAARLKQVAEILESGKELQWRIYKGDWDDWKDNRYGLLDRIGDMEYEFRAKPEPLEFWANVYEGNGSVRRHPSREMAEYALTRNGRTVLLREVIE